MIPGTGFLFDCLFHRDRLDREMDEELRSHIEMRAADLQKTGLPADEARRQACIEFGTVEKYKQECRETRRFHLLQGFISEVRYGLRTLSKSPEFSVVAVLILALGIGANTAIFSVVRSVLLARLPFREPDRVVALDRTSIRLFPRAGFYEDANSLHLLENVAAYCTNDVNYSGGGNIRRITVRL